MHEEFRSDAIAAGRDVDPVAKQCQANLLSTYIPNSSRVAEYLHLTGPMFDRVRVSRQQWWALAHPRQLKMTI